MRPVPDPIGPGQESVWSYPRPAVAERTTRHVEIVHGGVVIVSTSDVVRTLETSHPPSYYVPIEAVAPGILQPSARRSVCEWKGQARYFDVVREGTVLSDVAWTYPDPTPSFALLRGRVAFYPAPFDLCRVDGETVIPQPSGFYGGWITGDLAGPFKGGPGTMGW